MSKTDDNEYAEKAFVNWAQGIGLDDENIELILRMEGEDPLYNFASVRNLYESDGMGVSPEKDGFIFVGSCPNGDQIAIDLREQIGTVWYVEHSEMHCTPLREISIRVSESLDDMFQSLVDIDFPLDYFEAKATASG